MTRDELVELRGLVHQACDLRGGAYFDDGIGAIADWHERRHVRRLERLHDRRSAFLQLLRETAPESNVVALELAA